jgi:hypothetical protein
MLTQTRDPLNGTKLLHVSQIASTSLVARRTCTQIVRIVAETCGDCGNSKCAKCGTCHFCEDIDLPCAAMQASICYIVATSGSGRGGHPYPPVCVSSPDDWQRDQMEAARLRNRVSELLDELGLPRAGGGLHHA